MGKPTTIQMDRIFCCLKTCFHAIYVPQGDVGPWFCCREHLDQYRHELEAAEPEEIAETDGRAITDLINED